MVVAALSTPVVVVVSAVAFVMGGSLTSSWHGRAAIVIVFVILAWTFVVVVSQWHWPCMFRRCCRHISVDGGLSRWLW